MGVTRREQEALLGLARASIERYLRTGTREDTDAFHEDGAAFVTLTMDGDLRGCIGQIEATGPLGICVRDMAIAAATQDPRFPPLTLDEFAHVHIEISVMSPLERIYGLEDIRIGQDGLVVCRGSQKGLLLPQVAPQFHWDAAILFRQTCRKAGLSDIDPKDPGIDIYRFQANIFNESESSKD